MLAFVFTVSIIWLIKDWCLVQRITFILGFMFLFYPNRIGRGFFFNGLGLGLGLDSLSYILICLTFWIIGLVFIARYKIKDVNNYPYRFVVVNILLLLSLVLCFSCTDFIIFYICFERSLIPTLLLILG